MKLKELLKGREKLRKYDELKEWKRLFENDKPKVEHAIYHAERTGISVGTNTFEIPDYLKQIIISALEVEIAKLDEE